MVDECIGYSYYVILHRCVLWMNVSNDYLNADLENDDWVKNSKGVSRVLLYVPFWSCLRSTGSCDHLKPI